MKQPPAEIIVLLADDILDDRECDPLLWIPGLEHDYMPEFCTSYTRTDIVIRLRAENAELVAANTRLVVRLEKARVIIEGFQISHFRRDPEDCSCINCTQARAWHTGKDE